MVGDLALDLVASDQLGSLTAAALPRIPHHARAGVGVGHSRELALQGGTRGPTVHPLHLGGGGGERGIGCLRSAVDDEACTRQRLEGRSDRAVGIEVVRPGEARAQLLQQMILRRKWVAKSVILSFYYVLETTFWDAANAKRPDYRETVSRTANARLPQRWKWRDKRKIFLSCHQKWPTGYAATAGRCTKVLPLRCKYRRKLLIHIHRY